MSQQTATRYAYIAKGMCGSLNESLNKKVFQAQFEIEIAHLALAVWLSGGDM